MAIIGNVFDAGRLKRDRSLGPSADRSHFVVIEQSSGRVYAWGSNASGQIGDNSITDRSFPVAISPCQGP
jgi:alpha-tubulin suppressor-like RCC1 family protein